MSLYDADTERSVPTRSRTGDTIRLRIVRTLALPMAAVLVLLTVITLGEISNYRSAAATARAVTINLAVQALIQELQTERGLTAGLLGGNAGFQAEVAPARARVDAQRAAVEKLISGGGDVEDRVATAVRQLDGLAGVRAGTDTGSGARAATFAFYTGRIADLSQVDYGLGGVADAELRRGVAALDALSEVKEATAQERAFLNGVFSASGFRTGEFLQFVTMRSTKDVAQTAFGRYASASERDASTYVFDTGAAREAAYFEQVALKSGDGKYLQVNPQSWWSALTTVLDDLLQLEKHVGSVIQDRAGSLQDQATVRMGLLAGTVLVCLAGSAYLATGASRSIARPLALLAAEANRLSSEQLPVAVARASSGEETNAPPPVALAKRSSAEIRMVADALDRVQSTAYTLATEQARLRRTTAESLANLSRRNQNLLRRQLGFITRLEREETNPTGLANLFELDHLATRMRRNAESLLVLVGAASPRQWSEPLPVSDVIRAAISEVEEYRRVTLRRVDDAMVAGSAVASIAHMLAELIENGLAFSPPDLDVEIHGRMIGSGYLIAIIDQGIGLAPAELERANERLRGEGDFITAPAKFLGHYVIGRLAVGLGVDVQLAPSPVTGITARISLPPETITAPQGLGSVPEPPRAALPQREPAPARPNRPLQSSTIEYVVVGDSPVRPAPAPVPVAVAAAPPSPSDLLDDDADRTQNGLRKRSPRRRQQPSPGPLPSAADEPSPLVAASPEAVRSRLTALRDGVRRGDAENARRS